MLIMWILRDISPQMKQAITTVSFVPVIPQILSPPEPERDPPSGLWTETQPSLVPGAEAAAKKWRG